MNDFSTHIIVHKMQAEKSWLDPSGSVVTKGMLCKHSVIAERN